MILRIGLLLSGIFISLLIGSCTSVIPDQEVSDLFGLETLTTNVVLGQEVTQGLSPAALTIMGQGEINTSFTDISVDVGFNKFYVNIELADEVIVNAPDHPNCSFEVTDLKLIVVVADGQSSITLPPFSLNKRLKLNPISDTEYRIVTEGAMIGGVIDGNDLDTLVDIISKNGTNTTEATIQVETFSIPALPKGTTITFKYKLVRGVVDF